MKEFLKSSFLVTSRILKISFRAQRSINFNKKKITRHAPCIFFLFVRTLLSYELVLEFIRFWRQNDFHMRSWCLLLTTNDPTELMAKCLIT
jgi:hypothetical protein